MRKLVQFSIDHPRSVMLLTVILTVAFALAFPKIKIDTDPENMLREDEPIREFHRTVKRDFGIEELIVLGVVREDGIFQRDSLEKIRRITDQVLTIEGVIADDVVSLTVTNNVVARDGALHVRPPMPSVPETPEEIERLKKEVLDNPLFRDRLVSSDGRGAAIYIPIESKEIAHEVGEEIKAIYEKEEGPERYYMGGLPVAEDTFGYEMFVQMAIVAPLAGLLLMVVFFAIFRRVSLVIPPMLVAMLSVIWTMGALIGSGFTVHIMSSMIPVFLMPIAILDSVHILSEFHDRYPALGDRRRTMVAVMEELSSPMLYTSLTSAVGFGSQVLAPIPPVRVFGGFVAFGIMAAWLLTITLVPASVMLIREE